MFAATAHTTGAQSQKGLTSNFGTSRLSASQLFYNHGFVSPQHTSNKKKKKHEFHSAGIINLVQCLSESSRDAFLHLIRTPIMPVGACRDLGEFLFFVYAKNTKNNAMRSLYLVRMYIAGIIFPTGFEASRPVSALCVHCIANTKHIWCLRCAINNAFH